MPGIAKGISRNHVLHVFSGSGSSLRFQGFHESFGSFRVPIISSLGFLGFLGFLTFPKFLRVLRSSLRFIGFLGVR